MKRLKNDKKALRQFYKAEKKSWKFVYKFEIIGKISEIHYLNECKKCFNKYITFLPEIYFSPVRFFNQTFQGLQHDQPQF